MVALRNIVCCNCFVEFGINSEQDEALRNSHKMFYCPSGHPQSYTAQSEKEALRLERDRLKQQLAQKDDAIADEQRRREAAEKKAARVEKRARAALCPCCNRSFGNLARHMATKHKGQNVVALKKALPLP